MPGMDGFQVMEGLKTNADDSYLPVIVLTAQPGHKLRALKAGAKDFISKPFDLVEVKTRIHNMLEVRLLYKRLERFNEVLEQTVSGAHGGVARERSALSQPDRTRVRLVLGTGRDGGAFTKVSGPALEMLGCRVGPFVGEADDDTASGWNEDGTGQRCAQRSPIGSRFSISCSAASTTTVHVSSFL